MTMLDKIIYIADKIEDNRKKVPPEVRELAYPSYYIYQSRIQIIYLSIKDSR